ncbi:unnamed protein product [Symbiodinium natans]|uniref:C3H1-type domain-containing protein n=1 Tax=Symbiodinium natans TaxID=878477 RepID=A0A812GNQ1_9DINO|nr:unnamed protein product [Symbiodinium natans]
MAEGIAESCRLSSRTSESAARQGGFLARLQLPRPQQTYATATTATATSPSSQAWSLTKADKVALHFSRRCVPCNFFLRAGDGCRLGEACNHCHLCGEQEARTQRNRIQQECRRARKEGKTFRAGRIQQPRLVYDL